MLIIVSCVQSDAACICSHWLVLTHQAVQAHPRPVVIQNDPDPHPRPSGVIPRPRPFRCYSRERPCCPAHWPVYGWRAGEIPWGWSWWQEASDPGSCPPPAECWTWVVWSLLPPPAQTEDLRGHKQMTTWKGYRGERLRQKQPIKQPGWYSTCSFFLTRTIKSTYKEQVRCFLSFLVTHLHSGSQKRSWLSLWYWLRILPVEEPESAPDGKLSASPVRRRRTSPNSASPGGRITKYYSIQADVLHNCIFCVFVCCV